MASVAPQPSALLTDTMTPPSSYPQPPPTQLPLASEPDHTPVSPTSESSGLPKRVYRSMLDVTSAPSASKRAAKKQPSASGTPTGTPTVEKPAPLETVDASNQHDLTDPLADGTPLARPVTAPDLLINASSLPNITPSMSTKDGDRPITMAKKATTDLGAPSPTTGVARGNGNPRDFMKRVGSFLNKKNRGGKSPPREVNTEAESATAKIPTFSLSSTSATTSASATPPSPGSRESTLLEHDESLGPDQMTPTSDRTVMSGHGHSSSASNMKSPPRPRAGITWGPNLTDEGVEVDEPPRIRRRSVSQDHLSFLRLAQPKRDNEDVGDLMATFSFLSAEGAGMKARRLSASLPNEFYVDYTDLDSEFRSSSHFPGRRGQTIGKGATATVKLMFKKNDNSHTYYAVKEFRKKDKSEDEEDYVKKVKSEYCIAQSLHHPNIVQTVRLCTSHGRWNHVMEYCQFGEMFHWVEKGLFRNTFKLNDRLCFFKQLCRGVDYLHSHGIAHRDIKLENLLLTSEGHLKITDFGVSDVFCGEHPGLRASGGQCGTNMGPIRKCAPGICGSLPYIAPEVLEKGKEYDPRPLDVWSCAIVFLTMTFQGSPWTQAKITDERYSRFKAGWDAWMAKHPDGVITDETGLPSVGPIFSADFLGSPAIKKLIIKMLNPDPDKRIAIHDVLETKLVKGIECCTPETCDDENNPSGDCCGKLFAKTVMRKHNHVPPKEHKTPGFLQHRFDMGDGYR